MPPLNVEQHPVGPALRIPWRAPHPAYGFEPLTPKEAVRGDVFSVDTPYLATPMGWGEWEAVTPYEAATIPASAVVELAPPTHRH